MFLSLSNKCISNSIKCYENLTKPLLEMHNFYDGRKWEALKTISLSVGKEKPHNVGKRNKSSRVDLW